jgi:hypothetical protein
VGAAVDNGQETKPALPGLPYRFNSEPLRLKGRAGTGVKRVVGHPTTFHIPKRPEKWWFEHGATGG